MFKDSLKSFEEKTKKTIYANHVTHKSQITQLQMSNTQNFGLNNPKKINLRFYNNKCND